MRGRQRRKQGAQGLRLNNASFKPGAPIKSPEGLRLWKLVALAASFPSAVPQGEVKESQGRPEQRRRCCSCSASLHLQFVPGQLIWKWQTTDEEQNSPEKTEEWPWWLMLICRFELIVGLGFAVFCRRGRSTSRRGAEGGMTGRVTKGLQG